MNKRPTNDEATSQAALETVMRRCPLAEETNTVWADKDGERLVVYLPHYIRQRTADELMAKLDDVVKKSSGSIPKDQHRFSNVSERAGGMAQPRMVLEFTVRQPQGHRNETPAISRDFVRTCKGAQAIAGLFTSEAYESLVRTLSIVLCALDEKKWKQVRTRVEQTKKLDPLWALEQRCGIQCFVSLFILCNVFSGPHFDVRDVPDGWAAMVVLGEHKDGHLYLPDVHASLPYRTRDVVFFRAALLDHFSSVFEGKRYVLVFTNSQQLFEYLERFA